MRTTLGSCELSSSEFRVLKGGMNGWHGFSVGDVSRSHCSRLILSRLVIILSQSDDRVISS